jgi:hypothetical protein
LCDQTCRWKSSVFLQLIGFDAAGKGLEVGMNFSADHPDRKWSPGLNLWDRSIGGGAAAAVALMLLACPNNGLAVPLPKARPSTAPHVLEPGEQTMPATPEEGNPIQDNGTGREAASLSPCRLALSDTIAVAPSVPSIKGPGACGGDDLVRLEAVVLSAGQHVAVKPAAVLRCSMATAIASWVRTDLAQLAGGLGGTLSEIDNFDSYECRGRNRVVGAKLSEHGKANALDVRGFKLSSGRFVSLTDRAESRELREQVLQSVCTQFSTVLGPGSDWYHEDHIHLDLAERRSGYRTCRWDVYDPLPAIAPLLPAVRPDEAPPRDTEASRQGGHIDAQGPADVSEPEASGETDAPEASPPVPIKQAKSRRVRRP